MLQSTRMNAVRLMRSGKFVLLTLLVAGCSQLSVPFVKGTPDVIGFSDLSDAQQKHYELSLNYIDSGHYDVAEGKLLSLIEEYPNYPGAYNALGVAYERRGRVTVASEAFLKAMELDQSFDIAVENYSRLVCYTKGGDAIVSVAVTYGSSGVKSLLYTAAGRCYISRNEFTKADDIVRRAISAHPDYALNYLYLAQIELHDHDYVAAKKAIDQFNDLNGYTSESVKIGLLINQGLGDHAEVNKYKNIQSTQFKAKI